MGTKHPEIFAALMEPFAKGDVKERPGGQGRQLHYVTAATVANRLDNVLGPESWDFELSPWGADALIGTLIIRLPDGSVVRKSNVGGKAAMQADDDNAKSAASDCFKRCASLLGIGRHLQRDGLPSFVQEHVNGEVPNDPPTQQRRPESKWGGSRPDQDHAPSAGPSRKYDNRPPTSGRAMFAWTKDQEQRYQVGLLKYLNEWSGHHEFPARMVDWDSEQVALAYAEAMRKLGNEDDRGDAYEDALSN